MDNFFAYLFAGILCAAAILGLSECQVQTYINQSERVAETAGWDMVGCDVARIVGFPYRVLCLVNDENGKVVDIDNIRSD
jgi:hypothetical protein